MNEPKHLSEPWFSLIENGRKRFEGRPSRGSWANLKVGDILIFYNDDGGIRREFTTHIVGIQSFDSFETAINFVGLENVLPSCFDDGLSVDDAVKQVYHKYYGADVNNVLLFEIKVQ